MTESLDTDEAVLEIDRAGGLRYYQLSAIPFTADQPRLGQSITFTDITDRERYRSELERQNQRLERFASMVSHDLRNPLNVATGRLELARDDCDSQHLEAMDTALDWMEALIGDVLTLARQGQPIDETDHVSLSAVVEQCWEVVDTQKATLTVESDRTIETDPTRLQQLLENLFRNAIDHAVEEVSIQIGALPERKGF